MEHVNVGANILRILTESLYDNPIVVFREYVQNSADSIFSCNGEEECEVRIISQDESICFIDNGTGIKPELFWDKMTGIADSEKKKTSNLGYKGIGRLSGVPYCEKVYFINVLDYSSNKIQWFSIDGKKYFHEKDNEKFSSMDFKELMDSIGKFKDLDCMDTLAELAPFSKELSIMERRNTGFIVIMSQISDVLRATITDDDFEKNLCWLLPVGFNEELSKSEYAYLFDELSQKNEAGIVAARHCQISYNTNKLYRPITPSKLRKFVCRTEFENYAVGIHSFNSDRIKIDGNNDFSGIRLYIDNMLLCDETELLQNLINHGLSRHTVNELLQSVRGIGVAIYITDKISISANARRTFIEVTDAESFRFLELVAEFVNDIYEARYALSRYMAARERGADQATLSSLKEKALFCLNALTQDKLELSENELSTDDVNKYNDDEKKRILKRKINAGLGADIKEYLNQVQDFSFENAYDNFIQWLFSVKHK